MDEVQWIALDRFDLSAQTRAGLREAAVDEYREVIENSGQLEPALAFQSSTGELYLSSGFHRRRAYELADRKTMPCVVKPGSLWDAIVSGIAANLVHRGERPSRADKRRAVEMVLRERPNLSDRAIADICGVHHSTVSGRRSEMELSGEISHSSSRQGKDGRLTAPRIGPAEKSRSADDLDHFETACGQASCNPTLEDHASLPDLRTVNDCDIVSQSASEQGQQVEAVPTKTGSLAVHGEAGTLTKAPTYDSREMSARPTRRPISQIVEEAYRRLGYFAKAVDEIKSADPIAYRALRGFIEDSGNVLERLEKAAA